MVGFGVEREVVGVGGEGEDVGGVVVGEVDGEWGVDEEIGVVVVEEIGLGVEVGGDGGGVE